MGKKATKTESKIPRRPLEEILKDNNIPKDLRNVIEKNYDTSLYPEMFYTAEDFSKARQELHIDNRKEYHTEREEIIAAAIKDARKGK